MGTKQLEVRNRHKRFNFLWQSISNQYHKNMQLTFICLTKHNFFYYFAKQVVYVGGPYVISVNWTQYKNCNCYTYPSFLFHQFVICHVYFMIYISECVNFNVSSVIDIGKKKCNGTLVCIDLDIRSGYINGDAYNQFFTLLLKQ